MTRRARPKTLASSGGVGGSVTDLALTARGAVAWIFGTPVGNPFSPSGTSYAVRLADGAGTRSLASGQNIVPGSLAISGTFVYWRRAAMPFSAKLTN